MADDGLDYDDLISQNILIRREEKADNSATVEVLKKQNDDYENLYQKQAEIYQMDVELHGYVETEVKENYESDDDKSTTDSSDYEAVVQTAKRELSPDYGEYSSSDSDWEVQKKPKFQKKEMYQCDECDKKWTTTRGLLVHKRAHARQKLKEQQMQQPEEEVVVQPDLPVKSEDDDDDADSPAEADEEEAEDEQRDAPVEAEDENGKGEVQAVKPVEVENDDEVEEEEEADEEDVGKSAD